MASRSMQRAKALRALAEHARCDHSAPIRHTPEREARVREIRMALAEDSYRLDPESIADALLTAPRHP